MWLVLLANDQSRSLLDDTSSKCQLCVPKLRYLKINISSTYSKYTHAGPAFVCVCLTKVILLVEKNTDAAIYNLNNLS